MADFKKLAVCGLALSLFMLAACGAESQPPAPEGDQPAASPAAAAPTEGMSPMPSEGENVVPPPRPSRENTPLPWELKDADGNTVKLADHVGKKGILMVFFATWCPHCMAEVPQLIEFSKKYEKQPVEVIAIAINQPEQAIKQFIKARDVNYTVVLDSDAAVAKQYNVPGIPLNIGIDGAGSIILREHALPKDMDEFAKQLMTGLPGGPPVPARR